MKIKDREKILRLEDLPNVGKAIADRLRLTGINRPEQLAGKDPFDLYDQLCAITGERQDLCVLDTFMATIHFIEGGDPLPWWLFTDERKSILAKIKGD